MREYKINLSGFGISDFQRDEIINFCKQYREKKNKLKNPKIHLKPEVAGKYKSDIRLMEKTAFEIDEELAPYILKIVSGEVRFSIVSKEIGSRNIKRFNDARRRYYKLLIVKREREQV